jgi:hypothetical protein
MMDNDGPEALALGVLGFTVTLMLGLVLGLALAFGSAPWPGGDLAAAPVQEQGPPGGAEATDPADPHDTLRFAADSARLPPEAQAVLARLADEARLGGGRRLYISAWRPAHAASAAADLAQARALAVQHALLANGVPPAGLVLEPPRTAPPEAGAPAAARVDLRLR